MSENWQSGDLALCVAKAGRGAVHTGWDASVGGIYTVSFVAEFVDGGIALDLEEDEAFHPQCGFCASRFRKVTPPAADADDQEIIEIMQGKPAKVGEPA